MSQAEFEPVLGPRVWTGPDMATRESEWTREFAPDEIAQLDAAITAVQQQGIEIINVRKESFPLPTLGPALEQLQQTLQRGRGFVRLRGLPVERYDTEQAAIAYFGIGAYLGQAVSQNARGHALGHVYNLGFDPTLPTARGYQSANKLNFHTDPTDLVGLLCLRKSKSGGMSSIVSAGQVFNTILKARPDLIEVLAGTFYRDRRGEIPVGREPWYRLPVFNFRNGALLTNYVRSTIEKAQRFDDVPRITDLQREAFAFIEQTTSDPALHLNMAFEPGDIQILNNHYILHSRTAYEDFQEPEKRRHLLRLWLASEHGPALPEQYYEFMDKTASGRPNGYLVDDIALTTPLTPEDGGPGTSTQRVAAS